MSDEDPVQLDVEGGVATITLNRPERHNAFTDAMDAALWAALERVRGIREVGCVVLRGAGESFSSGRDLDQLGKRPAGVDDYEFIKAGHGVATDMVLTGRTMDAHEALGHGIVSRVVEAEDLDVVVKDMASQIASRPRLAVKLSLESVRELASPPIESSLDRELLAQTVLMSSDEYRAARDARLA